MTRPTISTGDTAFTHPDRSPHRPATASTKPFKIAILGDFSGRESRGLVDPQSISKRRALRISKDNFDGVFAAMNVRLQLPTLDAPLAFAEMDDLHPDFLYERLPVFEHFAKLKKQLLTPADFELAAGEIKSWGQEVEEKAEVPRTPEVRGDNVYSLDSLLDNTQAAATPASSIEDFIKSVVGPYVQPSPDPRQAELLQIVEHAASQSLRDIMHQSAFQDLEATWRAVYMLLGRTEDHPLLQLDLIDISKEELKQDFERADDLQQSQTFITLVDRHTSSGSMPYNLILADFYMTDEQDDVSLLIDLATLAQAVDGGIVAGASTKLAGCYSLAGSADPDDWYYPLSEDFANDWHALRDYDASEHVCLAAPRFLLRLPYGKHTSRTEAFDFEELPEEKNHRYYLWGNSAYLITAHLCHRFSQSGFPFALTGDAVVENMPMHIISNGADSHLQPCTEAALTDRGAKPFVEAGLTVMRSSKQKDEVRIPAFTSLASSGQWLGPWNIDMR